MMRIAGGADRDTGLKLRGFRRAPLMNTITVCPGCKGETSRLVFSPLFGAEVCAEVSAPTQADLLFHGLAEQEQPSREEHRRAA